MANFKICFFWFYSIFAVFIDKISTDLSQMASQTVKQSISDAFFKFLSLQIISGGGGG